MDSSAFVEVYLRKQQRSFQIGGVFQTQSDWMSVQREKKTQHCVCVCVCHDARDLSRSSEE